MDYCKWDINKANADLARADELIDEAREFGKALAAKIRDQFIVGAADMADLNALATIIAEDVADALHGPTKESRDLIAMVEEDEGRAYAAQVRSDYVGGLL